MAWNRQQTATTTERGYGAEHRQLRNRWAIQVARGTVRCWRPDCRRLILPGQAWHLGHDDLDRSKYRGPEHRMCNLRAAAREARRRQVEAKRGRWYSQSW